MFNIKVLLLAAGNSKRFFGIKAIAKAKKNTQQASLLAHACDSLHKAIIGEGLTNTTLYIATGRYHQEIADTLDDVQRFVHRDDSAKVNLEHSGGVKLKLLYCDEADQGMGHSIAQSVAHISQDDPSLSHIVVALADHIALTAQDYQQIFQQIALTPDRLICASNAEIISVPAVFPQPFFQALEKLSGDKGAKGVLMANTSQLIKLPLKNAMIDIDTPHDLKQWNANN